MPRDIESFINKNNLSKEYHNVFLTSYSCYREMCPVLAESMVSTGRCVGQGQNVSYIPYIPSNPDTLPSSQQGVIQFEGGKEIRPRWQQAHRIKYLYFRIIQISLKSSSDFNFPFMNQDK